MPRKTKEQELVEKEKKAVKKSSTAKKTNTKKASTASSKKKASATKTSTSTTKKVSTKKASASTTKKASTKKASASATKKASTKKATASATKKATTKKASASTTKKSTTKKASRTSAKKTSTRKKSTSSTKKVVEAVEYYDIPYRYNQTIVKILAQTPTTLFVYWDISDSDRENFKKQYGDNFFDKTYPVLIIHNDSLQYSFEVGINDFANSWYLKVKDSNCNYRIELGRKPILEYTKNEPIPLPEYFYITTSNSLIAPNDHVLFTEEDPLFRNIKTNTYTRKSISSLKIKKGMQKIYNIYDIYQKLYKDEQTLYDLSNPSSGNPTSGNIHIGKFN